MSKSWPRVRLGDAVREEREAVGTFDGCGLPVFGVTNVVGVAQTGIQASEDRSKYLRLRPGRFVYNPYRVNVGSIGLSTDKQDGICSPAYVVFAPTEHIDPHFLQFFLKSGRGNQLINFHGNRGTVRGALRFDDLCNIELPLPPLAEQRRVVVRIEELATQIQEARSLRSGAVQEAHALFEQGRATVFKSTIDGTVVPLEEMATLERGKFSHRPRNEPRFFGGNHPWIQIAEIERSTKYIREWHSTLNDDGLAISKKFPKGTVLISIAATIGATGILTFDCCVPDSIVGVTPREGTDSEFLYHYLGYVRTHLESVAPQSAQKNINLQILAPLPVPKIPVPEQREIVSYLDCLQGQLEALWRVQAETAAELDVLLPAVLDRAFKGELV